MPPEQSPDDGAQPIAMPAGLRRNAIRRIFREMVAAELEAGPLSWVKRAELIDFAVTAGLDAHEAKLTVRAVEYERGMAGDLALDPAEDRMGFLLRGPTTAFIIKILVAIGLGMVLAMSMRYLRPGA